MMLYSPCCLNMTRRIVDFLLFARDFPHFQFGNTKKSSVLIISALIVLALFESVTQIITVGVVIRH